MKFPESIVARVGSQNSTFWRRRLIPRSLKVFAAVGCAVGLLIGGWASPASAATGGGGVAGTGVSGYANWTWHTAALTNLSMEAWDTACDNNPVYVRLRVYSVFFPDGTDTQPRYNHNGCNTTAKWPGLEYSESNNITGVRVYACVDDWGSDTCFRSGFIDNPLI